MWCGHEAWGLDGAFSNYFLMATVAHLGRLDNLILYKQSNGNFLCPPHNCLIKKSEKPSFRLKKFFVPNYTKWGIGIFTSIRTTTINTIVLTCWIGLEQNGPRKHWAEYPFTISDISLSTLYLSTRIIMFIS